MRSAIGTCISHKRPFVGRVRNKNVDVPLAAHHHIKVLANGAWAGVDRMLGKAAADAACRKRQVTYPKLLAPGS